MRLWSRAKPYVLGGLSLAALLVAGVFLVWDLWRAAQTGEIEGRRRTLVLVSDPEAFWLSVTVHVAAAIATWGLAAAFVYAVARRPAANFFLGLTPLGRFSLGGLALLSARRFMARRQIPA